jgi:SAM-dependent methyltransferase
MRLIKILKNYIADKEFNPGVMGIFFNPFYFARKGLLDGICECNKGVNGKLLDVGCGNKPYRKYFHVDEYVGLEIDTPGNRVLKKADYYYDGLIFPFNDDSFNAVFSSQVFEHVFNPDVFFKEVNRVIINNGFLIITVPFFWDEHEEPFDFARYSSFGLRYFLENNNFKVLKHIKSNNDFGVIVQMLNVYLYRTLIPKQKYLKFLVSIAIFSPINIFGVIIRAIMPKNNNMYVDNIILAQKIKNLT